MEEKKREEEEEEEEETVMKMKMKTDDMNLMEEKERGRNREKRSLVGKGEAGEMKSAEVMEYLSSDCARGVGGEAEEVMKLI